MKLQNTRDRKKSLKVSRIQKRETHDNEDSQRLDNNNSGNYTIMDKAFKILKKNDINPEF